MQLNWELLNANNTSQPKLGKVIQFLSDFFYFLYQAVFESGERISQFLKKNTVIFLIWKIRSFMVKRRFSLISYVRPIKEIILNNIRFCFAMTRHIITNLMHSLQTHKRSFCFVHFRIFFA